MFQLIQQNLFYNKGDIVFDVGLCIRLLVEIHNARTGPVKLVFEIVIADCAASKMTYNQIPLSGPKQLPPCTPFDVGVDRSFAGPGMKTEKFIDPLTEPQLVNKVNMKPVAKPLSHAFMACKVCLCLDRTVGGVYFDRFPIIMLALVLIDIGHRGGRHIVDHDPLYLRVGVCHRVIINIVRADPAMPGKQRQLTEQNFRIVIVTCQRWFKRKAHSAHRFQDRRIT